MQRSDQPENIVATICRLAKAKDKPVLKKIFNSTVCVGVRYQDTCAVRILAKEGNAEAVDFLLDEFYADICEAAAGYAEGGFEEQLNRLQSEGAPDFNNLSGYGLAGNINAITSFISSNPSKSISSAFFGLAQGGYKQHVDDLLISTPEDKHPNLSALLLAYALGGHDGHLNRLVTNDNIQAWLTIIQGFARSGQTDKVNKLLSKYQYNLRWISKAVSNYAFGGYLAEMHALLQQFPNPELLNQAAYGLAFGGHIEEVNKLLAQGANPSKAIEGYASGAHHKCLDKLIEKHPKQVSLAKESYKRECHLANKELVIKTMSLVNHPALILSLSDELDDAPAGILVAEKNKEAIRKYQIPYRLLHGLFQQGARTWLLEGKRYFKKNHFPYEVYIHIMSYLACLSDRDTVNLYNAVHLQLLREILEENINKFIAGEINLTQRTTLDKEALTRHHVRMAY